MRLDIDGDSFADLRITVAGQGSLAATDFVL
jgi:hypothetical protein